jgi:hypothetical protein
MLPEERARQEKILQIMARYVEDRTAAIREVPWPELKTPLAVEPAEESRFDWEALFEEWGRRARQSTAQAMAEARVALA